MRSKSTSVFTESQEPVFARSFEDLGLTLENTDLSQSEKDQFKNIVGAYNQVFALSDSELTGCVLGSLKLRPKEKETKPFRAKVFPQSTPDRLETERQIENLLKAGFIERSTSNFSSGCFWFTNRVLRQIRKGLCLTYVPPIGCWNKIITIFLLSPKSLIKLVLSRLNIIVRLT